MSTHRRYPAFGFAAVVVMMLRSSSGHSLRACGGLIDQADDDADDESLDEADDHERFNEKGRPPRGGRGPRTQMA
jgi:hypothetical protein